jgi:uncharacterized protein
MRILIDIGHPAHVHFFKNFIWEMEKRGHEILVTARDKEVSIRLLDAYNIKHIVVGKMGKGKLYLYKEWLQRDSLIYQIAMKFKPDILTGINNPCAAHVAWLTRVYSVIFNDTEHARLSNRVTNPFASVICTPSCFTKYLGDKQVNYNGYHELAYLHPNRFKPDSSVLKEMGIAKDERFFVVRFISWGASHDSGQRGFDLQGKKELVAKLEKYGRIIITSESPLPEEFEKYRITVTPEKLHDLLYYATLYIGEGATVASECAVLGTPAIYVNTLGAGTLDEQEKRYGLIYNFHEPETAQTRALGKAIELLQQKDLKKEWQGKRQKLLKDKVDVTGFMVDFIENFPESFKTTIKGTKNSQNRFFRLNLSQKKRL